MAVRLLSCERPEPAQSRRVGEKLAAGVHLVGARRPEAIRRHEVLVWRHPTPGEPPGGSSIPGTKVHPGFLTRL